MPLGRDTLGLRFHGVTALHLHGDFPLLGLRLIDASRWRGELPGPICALHYRWNVRDESEPYFWAAAVERLTDAIEAGARESDGAHR